jgi:hypothetical protein
VKKAKKKLAELEQKHRKLHKKIMRLDASQNALRVVEQAIGGKLIAPKSSNSRKLK